MKRHSIRTPRIGHPGLSPWLTPVLLLILIVISVITLVAYFYPDNTGSCGQYGLPVAGTGQVGTLEEQIAELGKERDAYRLQAAQHQRASQIDKEVVSTVQLDLKNLQEERAELRQQVEFLKSLVSGDITAIQLLDFQIEKADTRQAYRYKLKVSKRAKEQDKVQGKLAFSILGKQAGKTKRLQAADMQLDANTMTMSFQNFQNYRGTFKLPDNFEPKTFKVKVSPEGDKFKGFERDFPWSLVTQ